MYSVWIWSSTFILAWIVSNSERCASSTSRAKKKSSENQFDETIRLTTFVNPSGTFCDCLNARVSFLPFFKCRNKMCLNLCQVVQKDFLKSQQVNQITLSTEEIAKKKEIDMIQVFFFRKISSFFQVGSSENLFTISVLNQFEFQNFQNDFVMMIVFGSVMTRTTIFNFERTYDDSSSSV